MVTADTDGHLLREVLPLIALALTSMLDLRGGLGLVSSLADKHQDSHMKLSQL
jgi:hypothetical protein